VDVRQLTADDVALVRGIDRAEHVDVQYAVVDGRLVQVPVRMADIPSWDADGRGEHSVEHHVHTLAERVAEGCTLLGAFDDDAVLGLAAVHPTFEPPMAWLAWLHVGRPHRRRGVATALWAESAALAIAAGATSMYVSATSTGSAVGFYLSRGAELARPPHPELFALEPVDVHLVARLG
jgi:GNAT superfamily N-acetyltransferase